MLSNETEVSRIPLIRPKKQLGIEWFGQTAASIFWIASVFAYGVSSTGDILQLAAASAWLLANISAALPTRIDVRAESRTQ